MPDREAQPAVRTEAILVFLGGLLLFAVAIPGREFIQVECRWAMFAREWLAHGATFFPTVYGQPYPDYPPTYTLLTAILSRLTGGVNVFSVALPTAACAAATLALTYALGVALVSRRAAWCAVALELLTVGFVTTARSVYLDHAVAAVTVAGVLVMHSAHERNRPWRLVGVVCLLAVGLLFRGPVGVAVPGAVFVLYYAAMGRYRLMFGTGVVVAALLGLGVAALHQAARLQAGDAFAATMAASQSYGRFLRPSSKPLYYYFVDGLGMYALAFPLALVLLWPVRRRLFRWPAPDETVRRQQFLLLWMLVVPCGFTLPTGKHMQYILPMVPAAALLAAWLLTQPEPGRLQTRLWEGLLGAGRSAPAVGLVAVMAGWIAPRFHAAPALQELPLGVAAVVFLALWAGQEWLCRQWPARRDAVRLGGGVAAFGAAIILLIDPLQNGLERTAPFARQVEAVRTPQEMLLFYRIGPDQGDIKFMANVARLETPAFCQSLEELITYRDAACVVIMRQRDVKTLPAWLVARWERLADGNIGHQECSAFRVRRPAPAGTTVPSAPPRSSGAAPVDGTGRVRPG
ncbi:MAG: hypothetical protein A3K19_02535 [Lentisphaerae bacterium RIFOXYB12_FULL_65_16]|nr:MAG: hypothetical protein A3K18_21225 [Lentisphaerae bacterium RIFOXYA12_64_32]OGV93596.1 MAG: hypothetical protein A3K19_02535 [Lentisphaerae bacterium RIFOXYB12_FULL_65_16]